MITPSWEPILSPERAAEAQDVIDAILTDLDQPRFRGSSTRWVDPFIALSFAEAARQTGRASLAAEALARLDTAIESLERTAAGPALFGGFCGIGWLTLRVPPLAASVAGAAPTDETSETTDSSSDPCEEVDDALLEALGSGPWQGDYDLISGLVGIGVYALEGGPRPQGAAMLQLIVEHLASSAVDTPSGLTWWTPPARLPEHQRVLAPMGYRNLGLAHGVPGVVALLGHVCRAGVAVAQASRLLEGAVSWILSEQLAEGSGARFPSWSGPGTRESAARQAWCYGGLGIAASLMIAARSVESARWESAARAVALLEAARPFRESGVRDACLCHGAAGNAHIFSRLYHATSDDRFLAAARWWYEHTLDGRRAGSGIGGYRFHAPVAERATSDEDWISSPDWNDEPSLVSGAAGVALALQTAIGTRTPAWDRVLLVDIPPA